MRASSLLALTCALLVPAHALAFSDYELFSLPPLEGGGGGGRYFTGSTSDGYGCSVCHQGGVAPIVQLSGLPEKEYTPGVSYDVTLTWLFPQVKHALNLELVTPQGAAGGTITLPDEAALAPEERCDAANGNMVASVIIPESAPRQVLSVNACGAQRVRFRFTAPADPQVMFAASIVRSDDSEKPEGDGVIELRRVLYRQGFAVSKSPSACSAARAGGEAGSVPTASVLLALALVLRWRRRGRESAR
jgi:hypothetical protein